MRRWPCLALLAITLTLTGCEPWFGRERPEPDIPSTGPIPSSEPTSPSATDAATSPDPGSAAGAVPAEVPPEVMVDAAVADLAGHLGVPVEDVSVVRVEEVTWSDGALGCPRPGRAYLQALVDGRRIELAAGGVAYWYHAALTGAPVRCEHPRQPIQVRG